MRQTLIATPGEERMEVRYPGTSMVTRLEMNKRIVREFYNLAFNERNPAEAAAKYVAESYRQHNPTVGDGPEGFVNGIGGFLNNVPDLRVDFKRFIAEGDLVTVHSQFVTTPESRGLAVVDIFRVKNGKIVEHWDVMQEVPENAANENTMF
jgi:predicted SnoaL-like aldol condensation-catalyzing enzyme